MSCDLTKGRLLGCRDQVGGVKTVYFIDFADLPEFTVDADDQITAIDATTILYKYSLQNGTASFTQPNTSSLENGTTFWTPTLEINLFGLTKEDRNEIQLMSRNTVSAVVEDFNGNLMWAGLDGGLTISAGDAKTGKSMGDMSGYTLTLTGAEKNMAKFIEPYTTTPFDNLGTPATDAANILTITVP